MNLTTKRISALGCVLAVFSPFALAASQGDNNGQPFQELLERIETLEAEIDALGGGVHSGPFTTDVDCDAGESVNAALAAAPSTASTVKVFIHGICQENVQATRSNLSFLAGAPGAGISVPNGPAVWNRAHDRVSIVGLTLESTAGAGVLCGAGSMVISDTMIQGSNNGVLIANGCVSSMFNSSIDGGSIAVNVSNNGVFSMYGVDVSNVSNQGMVVLNQSVARLQNGANGPTRFHGNQTAITVAGNASLIVLAAEIDDNSDLGIQVTEGGYIRVSNQGYMTIRNNGSHGLRLGNNATAAFWGDPTVDISGNGGDAITCDDSVRVGGSLTAEPNVSITGNISLDCPSNL